MYDVAYVVVIDIAAIVSVTNAHVDDAVVGVVGHGVCHVVTFDCNVMYGVVVASGLLCFAFLVLLDVLLC